MNSKFIIIIVIVLLLAWGIWGGVQTKSIGYTCSLGSPGIFCLMWNENALGMIDRITGEIMKEASWAFEEDNQEEFTEGNIKGIRGNFED